MSEKKKESSFINVKAFTSALIVIAVLMVLTYVLTLAIRLGWDAVTGMGMSLLAVGCGFAAGVFNPFTVGIAQELAGLPMFSGWWFRAIGFVRIYLLLMLFLRARKKAVDTGVKQEGLIGFTPDKRMDRAILCFAVIMGIGLAIGLA